jgi:hypothetical protein
MSREDSVGLVVHELHDLANYLDVLTISAEQQAFSSSGTETINSTPVSSVETVHNAWVPGV